MPKVFTTWVRPFQTREIRPPRLPAAESTAEDESKTVVLQWGGGASVKVYSNSWSFSVELYMEKQQREQEQDLNS